MSKDGFFFPDRVGMFEELSEMNDGPFMPVSARIELVQNGYELNYENKEFIAKNLDEALGMIRKWMEDKEKKMSKGKEKSEHNSEHEG